MTELTNVKGLFASVLRADSTLAGLLGKDRKGQVPVYVGWQNPQNIVVPSVTVTEVSETGEVSGLSDLFDGLKRYEWYNAVIQVDVWAENVGKRDEISSQVKKAIFRAYTSFAGAGIRVSPPTVTPIDELDVKPPVFRHSIRFPVTYVMEIIV